MKKQVLIAASILLSSTLANAETAAADAPKTPAPAATSNAADSSKNMNKKEWLSAIIPMLPSLICKGFMGDPDLKQRLDTIKMSYDQCVSAIPESVSKCETQLSPQIPETISNEDAGTWGKSIGECIGKDFATKYLIPK
ncbi:MAG: hypothetical protein P4L65_02710 [Legionella sp.]|nr:hypothetical protein [Legionella sp.]